MNNKKFSIVIPVYNASRSITVCLRSLVSQTFRNFEIVIVDDGSSDDSSIVIDQFFYKNPNVDYKIFRQNNSGAGAARNFGIDNARGEYLVFIDSDDYFDDDFLEKANGIIKKEKSDIVFIDIVREKNNAEIIRFEKMSDYQRVDKDLFIRRQLTGMIPWGGARKIIRRSIVKDGNHRYGTIKVGEESIYSFGILIDSTKVSFMNNSFYHYVTNETSLTANDYPGNTVNVFKFIKDELNKNGYADQYKATINALAARSVVIITNVIAQNYTFFKAVKLSKKYYSFFKPYIIQRIDKDALELRVKVFIPFMKLGIVTPMIIASYLKNLLRKH